MASLATLLAAHFAAAGLRRVALPGLGDQGADLVLWARPLTLAQKAEAESLSRNAAEYVSHVLRLGLLLEDRTTPALSLEDMQAVRRQLPGYLMEELAKAILEEGPTHAVLGEPSRGRTGTSPSASTPPPPPSGEAPPMSSATPLPAYCGDGLPTIL